MIMAQAISVISYGADVDSRFIQINRHGESAVHKIENSRCAIRAWLKSITGAGRLAVESTGAYHMELADQAHKAGLTVYVVNPRAIQQYREGVSQRAKNDRCDARLIARYVDREHEELRPTHRSALGSAGLGNCSSGAPHWSDHASRSSRAWPE